ncbi:DUF4259 domain-containing protein [Yinghuangia seranimata]|uniref:DUF4259 domain-containing protein n=1 Tax=Yinghuangia seranimata TaxID=408067 RepID=UPI00248B6C6E|nr:DUF4259 domain-containing protein [Yinghuangia seranimata]MDI2132927.1 DUF4259 domain-containing protein [Yinghuangia seranimata]
MGAWGFGPFEDDYGLDFAGGLANDEPQRATEVLADTMRAVVAPDGFIDTRETAYALAAAALVAGRADESVDLGPNGNHYLEMLSFEADETLRDLARRVFERAFTPADNAWYALWAEGGETDKLRAAYARFMTAVDGPADA